MEIRLDFCSRSEVERLSIIPVLYIVFNLAKALCSQGFGRL